MKRLLCSLAVAGATVCLPAVSHAAGVSRFSGSGYVLTLQVGQASYGSTLHGTLTYRGTAYVVQGDWIPAGDAGGDLLRFFGHPFPGNTMVGLVSVATLYNMCTPNCAAGRTFQLKPLGPWTLPGRAKGGSVLLKVSG